LFAPGNRIWPVASYIPAGTTSRRVVKDVYFCSVRKLVVGKKSSNPGNKTGTSVSLLACRGLSRWDPRNKPSRAANFREVPPVKKIFALLAVFSLAAIGCDDKKTTGKPSSATTGGTYVKTDTRAVDVTKTVVNTVVQGTEVVTNTKTVAVTRTVDRTPEKGGPGLPGDPKKNGGE
jgi:hypothetical protein